jgi:ribosomal protein L37AE/L43A
MHCPTCKTEMTEAGSLHNWWCPQCGTRVNPSGEAFVPTILGNTGVVKQISDSLLVLLDKIDALPPRSGN